MSLPVESRELTLYILGNNNRIENWVKTAKVFRIPDQALYRSTEMGESARLTEAAQDWTGR